MVLCLGEPLRRFLLYLDFIFILFLIFICCCSLFTFAFRYHPSQLRGLLSLDFYTDFILLAQPIAEWFTTISFSTIPGSSLREYYGFKWAFFTHKGFFTLRFFTNILDSTRIYQGLLGSRQFFLEVCRASLLIFETQTQPICLFESQ